MSANNITARPSIRRVLGFFGLLLGLGALLVSPAQGARILNKADQYGYIEIWNLLPPGSPAVTGTIDGGQVSRNPIGPFAPGYLGPYSMLPPGAYQLELTVGAESLLPVKLAIGKLRWFTVIIQPDDKGKPTTQVVEDTYAFKATDPGTITVRNYAQKGKITCGPAGQPPTPLSGYLASRQFANFAGQTGKVVLTLQSETAPRPRTAEVPLPFDECKSWVIVLINDERGRIVPRVAPLGYNAAQFQKYLEVSDEYAAEIGEGGASPTPSPSPAP